MSVSALKGSKELADEYKVRELIKKIAKDIVENFPNLENLVIVGIHTRGVHLAKRIQSEIKRMTGRNILIGSLDINLYRDDWTRLHSYPTVRDTHIPVNLDNSNVILVDDVLFTGRTIRAALDALIDFGRPQKVHLAVLVDRGHRELPICAQYVGIKVSTEANEHVHVFLTESDGVDRILLAQNL